VKQLVPKYHDRREGKFDDWLKENNRISLVNREDKLVLKNICCESIIIKKDPKDKCLKQGESANLEPGYRVRVEGKLFTVTEGE